MEANAKQRRRGERLSQSADELPVVGWPDAGVTSVMSRSSVGGSIQLSHPAGGCFEDASVSSEPNIGCVCIEPAAAVDTVLPWGLAVIVSPPPLPSRSTSADVAVDAAITLPVAADAAVNRASRACPPAPSRRAGDAGDVCGRCRRRRGREGVLPIGAIVVQCGRCVSGWWVEG